MTKTQYGSVRIGVQGLDLVEVVVESFLWVFTDDQSSVSGAFVGCHGWEGCAVVLPGSGVCR